MPNAEAIERFDKFASYLEQDPENQSLLRDTAAAALAADKALIADELFSKLGDVAELTDADRNLAGLAAMRAGDQAKAGTIFEALLLENPDEPGLKFNLAWSRALAKDIDGARSLLDDELVKTLPQAATLHLQLLHDMGEFESAGEVARELLQIHKDYPPLLAAISVLALDIEDEQLARDCANAAGEHPDALTTLATLTLGEQKHDEARAMFERALSANDQSPRAWIGLGLANLADGDHEQAVVQLDKGANIFEDHLGSWIAAGWAYFLKGDISNAKARFQTALDLDDSFAESHGSLAVVDAIQGDRDAAERRIKIALRLDRSSFSAAFARILLASGDGDEVSSKRIFELAVKQPIDPKGRTIADIIGSIARKPS